MIRLRQIAISQLTGGAAQSREATREAVGSGLNQSVETAFMAAQRTAEMREAKRREAHELAEERRMSYQQRVWLGVHAPFYHF